MSRVVTPVKSVQFKDSETDFNEQYAHLYFFRYSYFVPVFDAKKPFGDVPRSTEVLKDCGTTWFVGTVYCKMRNKPNIIDDVSLINHGEMPKIPDTYVGKNDEVFLQPAESRPILLEGNLEGLVTGGVVAVCGELNNGVFKVKEWQAPGFDPPLRVRSTGKLVILSGIDLDENLYQNPALSTFMQFLAGYLGDSSDLSRVIIAGNSLKEPPPELVGSRIRRPVLPAHAIFEFVKLISSIARDLPVHVMPGDTDPAPVALPQTPFHKGLFAGARGALETGALVLESNPMVMETQEGLYVMGTSGQPTQDLLKYDSRYSELDWLCQTLEYRHFAPTAPDTLPTYPFTSDDPLIMEHTPNIYFSGNCSRFDTKIYKGIRVACIPRFSVTGQAVTIDLETLETELLTFA